ncbi:MAG: T9SS type A sorting domain-containing protein [Saprospiraceae bacterium]|nr:T9SS type A sorting domain-containing protein [Saprospiraceae bacterium]
MKLKLGIILPIMLIWSEVFSQKEDYHWVLGYSDFATSDTNFGRAEIVFNKSGKEVKKFFNIHHKLDFTNASICDTSGKLLLYTNGLEIYNNEHYVIANGDSLNPGEFAISNECCGYTLESGALILKYPGSSNKYFIIHLTIDRIPFVWYSLNMLTTLVELNSNTCNLNVIYKNKSIYSDTLLRGSLSACRHANGRDWWIPCFFYSGKKCLMFLLDPTGLNLHHIQDIPFEFSRSGGGQAQFSPDGSEYAFIHRNSESYMEFFLADFDRCEGKFSEMNYETLDGFLQCGVAFSPNSELLYLALEKELYQLVLYEPNPFKNRLKIDSIDGFQSFPGFPSYFFLMQLAPDGKIYICNGRGPSYLSTIEFPDRRGKSCKVMQHNISIVANSSMPNFPYFRLGAAKGTVCDSLITSVVDLGQYSDNEKIKISPNPNTGNFRIQLPKEWVIDLLNLELYNSSGILLGNWKTRSESLDLDLNFIPGIYYLKILVPRGEVVLKKFIINK